jgi:hypothetical protein
MNTNTRFWTSPFAIGAYILSAITGLLFFLNAFTAISQSTHVWMSSLLVIAVLFHTVINWKQFT